MSKYIVVTGGVLSSVGKGTVASSIGLILKSAGYQVTAVKIDPYVNVDAGTMNPYMHGEVFVTEDGAETDLDLGHYERFLDIKMSKLNNITTGKVYYDVIKNEREGKYLGQTVQIIPHITDKIKSDVRKAAYEYKAGITIIEIGGTVGDIESLPFLEAMRQLKLEEGEKDVIFIHTALVELLKITNELKTKPLQHSVQELRRIGIQPDIIIARSTIPLDEETKQKIALFTNVRTERIFTNYDVENAYEVPLALQKQNIIGSITDLLGLTNRQARLEEWENFVNATKDKKGERVRIALVGKYTKHKDSYISIKEALLHASAHLGVNTEMEWIESSDLEEFQNAKRILSNVSGVIVLPGFGARGVEGKINAIRFSRENDIPFLGICYGMQLAVVEFARNVLKLEKAHTTEVDPATPYPVISMLDDQKRVTMMGGTMRLGSQSIFLKEGSLVWRIYDKEKKVFERHRHRYEVNPQYLDMLEKNGLRISGVSENGLVEFIELENHKFFVGTQPHPEFNSRPMRPSPLFLGFLSIASKRDNNSLVL